VITINLIRFVSSVYAACPDHCKQCTVNGGAVECNDNMCDDGYGIKVSDKSCIGTQSLLFFSQFFLRMTYV